MITSSTKPDRQNGADPRETLSTSLGREIPVAVKPLPAPLKKLFLVDHPIAQHALTILRDKHSSPKQLRVSSNQLLMFLVAESTRTIPTQEHVVEAARGEALGKQLSKPVVFISLARHGLGLSHAVTDLVPNLYIGSITLDSTNQGGRLEPRLHLASAPSLNECRIILFTPVVGSGISAGVALNLLRKSGALDLALITFVISSVGQKRVQSIAPETSVWTGAVDEDFDSKIGPVPGLGDFGQRLYSSES